MPITNNGPPPTDPKWGKVWLSEDGQRVARETGATIEALCAPLAVDLAMAGLNKRLTVEQLTDRIAVYCPPRTSIAVTTGGIRINGNPIGYTMYRVENALTPEAYAALPAPVQEVTV